MSEINAKGAKLTEDHVNRLSDFVEQAKDSKADAECLAKEAEQARIVGVKGQDIIDRLLATNSRARYNALFRGHLIEGVVPNRIYYAENELANNLAARKVLRELLEQSK